MIRLFRAARLVFPGLLLVAFGGCAATVIDGPPPLASPADLVVVDATIITMDRLRPEASAFAVSDGRFRIVGNEERIRPFIGPKTTVVDLDGAVVLPGLIDAHLHLFSEGHKRMGLDLVGTTSVDEVLRRVGEAAQKALPGTWLRGRGWDQNDWREPRYPTATELDAVVADRPVILSRVDGHAIWVNSRALELAGVDASTEDPPGGRIVRLEDGRPSGILIDNAADLVAAHVPDYSAREKAEAARRAAQACVAVGLTGVHEPGIDREQLAILKDQFRLEQLPLRIYAMLSPGPVLEQYLEAGPEVGLFGHHLTVRAVKLYADGALGSRGATLLADYNDDPGNRGLPVTSRDDLSDTIQRVVLGGMQPCVHAIGDAANREILDLYGEVQRDAVGQGIRPRIEHAQVVSPSDLERFVELGVVASMQPTHATSDMPWAEQRLGGERVSGAYAWRSLIDLGARVAFGSDAPVESINPMWGIYAAVTRADHAGRPPGGWRPEQRITIEEALRAFTVGAAYAAFEEGHKGSIEPGKFADFVVIDRDLRAIEPAELLEVEVMATWIGGKQVYVQDKR